MRETGTFPKSADRDGPSDVDLHIGVVIPVYGHSRLVAEAISSALSQDFTGKLHVVVVIDGDPHEETLQTVHSFLSTPDRQISAIYRRNGRLPAARNTGIRFLLDACPDLYAIYMLDADNRLSGHSIQAFAQALQADPGAGWAYPDVTFFGLGWGYSGCDIRETAPTYSPMRHRLGNICEAGSMVRADVFRAGTLYDETYTHGFEDWEFWLQCIEAGQYGVRVDNSGFLYRRRADSMLSDANRIGGEISGAIKTKHAALYRNETLWELFEAGFTPILYVDRQSRFFLMSTSRAVTEISLEQFFVLCESAYHGDHHSYFPKFLLYPLRDADAPPAVDSTVLKSIVAASSFDELQYLDADGVLSAQKDAAALYGVLPLGQVFSRGNCPPDVAQTAFGHYLNEAIVRAKTQPRLVHLARRYSGPRPPDIDRFLSELQREQDAPANAPMRCLVIGPQPDARSAPILDRLARTCKVEIVSYEMFKDISERDLRITMYNGGRLAYRLYNKPYELVGSLTASYDRTYVFDDFAALFHVGEWKHLARSVIFVSTRPLSEDQYIALQGIEHSLASIICERSKLAKMRACGIPGHKLLALEDSFANPEFFDASNQ